LIDIGAHRLHIQCAGQGRPTVVLEAGLGGISLEWHRIQQRLSRSHRVCSYDRAGVGWSEPGPNPRTSDQIADELHALLEESKESAPYVLVGHSFGGYTMQLFASRFPELSAALVLIDSAHPEQIERFAAAPVSVNIAPRGRLHTLARVALPDNIPGEVRDSASALITTHQSRLAVTRELEGFRYSARQVVRAAALPEIPLIVLTRGLQKWPDDVRGNRMEALWQQLQRELAEKTRSAAQIIALRSGHHIHLDQPQLVIDTIRLVAGLRRAHRPGGERDAMRAALIDAGKRFAGQARININSGLLPLAEPVMAWETGGY
jgi:pimeloyl-ACP methyl ester carboxylesterase